VGEELRKRKALVSVSEEKVVDGKKRGGGANKER